MNLVKQLLDRAEQKIESINFAEVARFTPSRKSYSLAGGQLVADQILDVDDCEAVYASVRQGAQVEPHHHVEVEMFIVISGKLLILEKDKKTVLRPGQFYQLPARKTHSMTAAVDSVVLIVRMPSSKTARL